MRDIETIEAEYLAAHPDSGYLTEILPLKAFPDYIDILPTDAIVRKIGVMGYPTPSDPSLYSFIPISRDEYAEYIKDTIQLVVHRLIDNHLL